MTPLLRDSSGKENVTDDIGDSPSTFLVSRIPTRMDVPLEVCI